MRRNIVVVVLAVAAALINHWLLVTWLEIPFFLYFVFLIAIALKWKHFRPYIFTFIFFLTYGLIAVWNGTFDFREALRLSLCFVGGFVISHFSITFRGLLDDVAKSEQKYKTIFDSSLDAIITVDKSGLVVEWNRSLKLGKTYPRQSLTKSILLSAVIRRKPSMD